MKRRDQGELITIVMDNLNINLPPIFTPDEINNNIGDCKNSSLLHNSSCAMSFLDNNSNGSSSQAITPCCEIFWPNISNNNECSTQRSETSATDIRVFRDKSKLAQMKANTKMKRIRKPYQLSHPRTSLKSHHSIDSSSLGSSACFASESNRMGLRCTAVRYTLPESHRTSPAATAPATLFYDDWSFQQKASSSSKNLSRTRSCEDLKRLAQTTTVSFSFDKPKDVSTTALDDCTALTETNAAVDDISSFLSHLQVVDPM